MTIIASRTITVEQSSQEVLSWLDNHYKSLWDIAFQFPLDPPPSVLLVLEPVLGRDGAPVVIQFAWYKDCEPHQTQERVLVFVFQFQRRLDGRTDIHATLFVTEWESYFHELLDTMGQGRQEAEQEEKKVDPNLSRLSEREGEVYRLVLEGKERQDIADELSITARSVDAHIQHISEKLGLTSTKSAKKLREWLKR